MNCYIDIETIPSGEPIDPRTLTPPSVMTKADTIEKWYVEKAPEIAKEKFKARALDSMQGEILCIGYAIDDGEPRCIRDGGEYDILAHFYESVMDEYVGSHTFIGWNIGSFDIVWLWRKAVKYDLRGLRNLFNRDRYRGNCVDLMQIWASDYKNYNKMDDVAKFLGLPGKPEGMDGSKIYDLYLEGRMDDIVDYCLNDVSTVRDIYRRICE
jgi:predicted PolB exonuclease-like 3'-5' exonuclease